MKRTAFLLSVLSLALSSNAAKPLSESLWFFADFDRPAALGGNALGHELSPTGVREGKFGRGYRFHRGVANRLPPMTRFLAAENIASNFHVHAGTRLPHAVAPDRLAFSGGLLIVTNRPAAVGYHYVRPSAAATWSFFVRGEKGNTLEVRAFLTPPTEAGIAEGEKKHGYKAENAVKDENPTATFTLDGTWQRVWAYAKTDNRISSGRETYCAIRSAKPIELERFQYETTGYYPEVGNFRPGVPLDGGEGEGAQLFVVSDQKRLMDFPLAAGGCSVWIRFDDLSSAGVESANVWGLNRSWQSNRGFTLSSLLTSAKSSVRLGKALERDAAWHHFAASWDGQTGVIWRDGVRIAENPLKETDRGDGRPWTFRAGGFGDGNATCEAVMDEIAIFNRPLDDADVKSLFTARKGLRDGDVSLTATPVIFKVFARNQADAALRRRVFAANARTCELTGEVGRLPIVSAKIRLEQGWNDLVVPFDPARFRPGKQSYAYRLTDTEGRTALADEGTLEIRGQVARDGFMIHSWGGSKSASSAFLRRIGVTARNVPSASVSAVREAVEAGLFANVRYENAARWRGKSVIPEAIADAATEDLAWLKGCHWWASTLVNSEVYGGGLLAEARKVADFDAFAASELGFKTDWPVRFAPDAVDWKAAGIKPPRGVLDVEPQPLAAFRWFLDRGMPAIRITAATVPGIRRLSPDNVVWTEPTYAVGLAKGVDMIAGWTYEYDTLRVLSGLYGQFACARAAGRPFMPTLEPGYHPNVTGCHPAKTGMDGLPLRVHLTPSVSELECKAMMAIAAVPAANLSLFNDEAWERGIRDAKAYLSAPTNAVECLAEPDAAERFGDFVRQRFMPAARLLRNLPNERAPVALAPSETVSLGGGFWWGHTHFLTASKLALARTGVPFDILADSEQTADALSRYAAVVAPMRNIALKSERDALAAALARGTEVMLDRYAQLSLDGATVLTNFVYEGGLVNPPGGMEKMGRPLETWARKRRDGWRTKMTAWSEEDGDGIYTFTKVCGKAKYVVVVNDTRGNDRGIFGNFKTNDWYRPMGASRTAHTHLNGPQRALYTFNPSDGEHRTARTKDGVVESRLGPGETRILCLLPEPVDRMKSSLEGSPCVGGKAIVRFSLEDAAGRPVPGRTVLDVRVTRPDGTETDESGRLAIEDGQGSMTLRFAHDDPPGSFFRRWRVEARDLITGECTACSFRLCGNK